MNKVWICDSGITIFTVPIAGACFGPGSQL